MDHQAFAQLLGNYGEFVGAIAVVATLAYLAVQIRNNTRSTYVDRSIALNQRFAELHQHVLANADLSELVAKCCSGSLEQELADADKERLRRLANLYVNCYAAVESAHRRDELQAESYEAYRQDFHRTLESYPGLVPYMRAIMEHFGIDRHAIMRPLFD